MRLALLEVLIAAVLSAGSAVAASPSVQPGPQPNDYNRDEAWLCRPARADACSGPLTTTDVPVDGIPTTVTLAPASDPPIDCFYVYPTVSSEPSPNADMTAGPEEAEAARAQFAAFGSACRLFAPIYRQTTLATLAPAGPDGNGLLAYNDVRDAFHNYMARDNHGRGVVLIGHSQGAIILAGLVRNDIDGQANEDRLVSALLIGTVIAVPTAKDVGGDFRHVPLCRSGDQTGCVIAFSSFRADDPPPETGYFGKSPAPGLTAACTNPAALGGGSAALGAEMPVTPRAAADLNIATTFIRLPGLVSGRCISSGALSYLAVRVADDRRGPLMDRALTAAQTRTGWGLHLLDVNLVLDDLVNLVKAQSVAWVARHTAH